MKRYVKLRKWIDDYGYSFNFGIFDSSLLHTIDLSNALEVILKISKVGGGSNLVILETTADFKDRKNGIISYTVQPNDFALSRFESKTQPIPKPWVFNIFANIYFPDSLETQFLAEIHFDKA